MIREKCLLRMGTFMNVTLHSLSVVMRSCGGEHLNNIDISIPWNCIWTDIHSTESGLYLLENQPMYKHDIFGQLLPSISKIPWDWGIRC